MTDQNGSDRPIFHIALPGDWADAFASGEYSVSTRGMLLGDVGFIHCSTAEQTEATANRFYGDLTELVLLTIDPLLVPAQVLWEPPTPDVNELFPHIYGPLPIRAVNTHHFWSRAGAAWKAPQLSRDA